jgi:NAD(P)-dependent dehydrogenase (short-subunit alcohol dehydrogenase family)
MVTTRSSGMTASRFNGSVCLVTGSAQGIGLATARRLAEEGATVFGLDVHKPTEDIPGVTPLIGDVTDLGSWQDALRATAGAGPLDALVNNAGTVGSYEPITEITLEDWERVVRINQTSVFYGMRTVLPGMIERRRGAIVNVSSMWGIIGASGVAAYQASKGAVTMMTKNAAATYAARGVRINSVHPGFIVTPMTQAQDPAISDGLVAQTPLGRAGQASEVAAAIAFLASDDASFITGVQLLVDGGFTTI